VIPENVSVILGRNYSGRFQVLIVGLSDTSLAKTVWEAQDGLEGYYEHVVRFSDFDVLIHDVENKSSPRSWYVVYGNFSVNSFDTGVGEEEVFRSGWVVFWGVDWSRDGVIAFEEHHDGSVVYHFVAPLRKVGSTPLPEKVGLSAVYYYIGSSDGIFRETGRYGMVLNSYAKKLLREHGAFFARIGFGARFRRNLSTLKVTSPEVWLTSTPEAVLYEVDPTAYRFLAFDEDGIFGVLGML